MRTALILVVMIHASASAGAVEPFLTVEHGPGGGGITLTWVGGPPPYEVFSSDVASLIEDPLNLVTTTSEFTWVESPTGTGVVYYRVRSSLPICTMSLAVGYPGNGNTCNFVGLPNAPDLPSIALDEFRYNEFFTGIGYGGPFGEAGGGFFAAGEGRGCGACLEIAGANGSIVGIVQEIADTNAVGLNGYPTGVHIDSADILDVRDGQGVAVDVTIRPVPCPHIGNIMIRYRMYNSQSPFYWTALEYVAYNHVYPILSVEIRAEVGHDQWYPLTPDWVARWNEHNVSPTVIPFPDPINGPVRLRITSLYGDVVTTDLIQHPDRPVPGAAEPEDFYYDSGVQFPARSIDPGPCLANLDCGNWMLDPAEECESSEQLSANCASLGAGTGTAYCDPGTCLWDRSTCSNP